MVGVVSPEPMIANRRRRVRVIARPRHLSEPLIALSSYVWPGTLRLYRDHHTVLGDHVPLELGPIWVLARHLDISETQQRHGLGHLDDAWRCRRSAPICQRTRR